MANLVDIVAMISMSMDGIPEPLLTMRYLDAAREFFRRTNAWKIDDPPFVINDTLYTDVYKIDMVDAELVDVQSIRYGDYGMLAKATREQTLYRNPDGIVPTDFRVTSGYLVLTPDPTIDVSASLDVSTASIRPTAAATTLHDSIVDEFGEIIEHGTMARLLTIPKRPWTDYSQAAFHLARFEEKIDYYKWHAADGGMQGVPRTVKYGGY